MERTISDSNIKDKQKQSKLDKEYKEQEKKKEHDRKKSEGSGSEKDEKKRKGSIFSRKKRSESTIREDRTGSYTQVLPHDYDINSIKQLFYDHRSRERTGKLYSEKHGTRNRHLTLDEYYALLKLYQLNKRTVELLHHLLRTNHSVLADRNGTVIFDFLLLGFKVEGSDTTSLMTILPSVPTNNLQQGKFIPLSLDSGMLMTCDSLAGIDFLRVYELQDLTIDGKCRRVVKNSDKTISVDFYLISTIDFLLTDLIALGADYDGSEY